MRPRSRSAGIVRARLFELIATAGEVLSQFSSGETVGESWRGLIKMFHDENNTDRVGALAWGDIYQNLGLDKADVALLARVDDDAFHYAAVRLTAGENDLGRRQAAARLYAGDGTDQVYVLCDADTLAGGLGLRLYCGGAQIKLSSAGRIDIDALSGQGVYINGTLHSTAP